MFYLAEWMHHFLPLPPPNSRNWGRKKRGGREGILVQFHICESERERERGGGGHSFVREKGGKKIGKFRLCRRKRNLAREGGGGKKVGEIRIEMGERSWMGLEHGMRERKEEEESPTGTHARIGTDTRRRVRGTRPARWQNRTWNVLPSSALGMVQRRGQLGNRSTPRNRDAWVP